MIEFVLLVLFAYFLGSINSAILICRMFSLPDPRKEGSKNPGATNVLRLGGKPYAAAVILFDMFKGLLPVIAAQLFNAGYITLGFTALAAVVGHIYPIFFGFKGGKGVATALGALLGLNFILGVVVMGIWLLVANFSHYSSLASMVSMCFAPLLAMTILGQLNVFPPLFFITILIMYQHRNNITRLMDGAEPKISFKHSVIEDMIEPEHPFKATAAETQAPETTEKKPKKPKASKAKKPKVKKSASE